MTSSPAAAPPRSGAYTPRVATTGQLRSRSLPPVWVLVAAAGLALIVLVAGLRFGPVALVLPLALVVGALLVRAPGAAVGLLLGLTVLAEADPAGFTPTGALYETALPGLSRFDLLFPVVAAVVALDCVRRREAPRLPPLLLVPLGLMAVAMAAGTVTGYSAGVGLQPLYAALLILSYLLLTPLMVAAVLRTPGQVRLALAVAAGIVALKATAGIVAVFAGLGTPEADGSQLTYYEPTPNWLIVVLLVTISAALLRRVRLPAGMAWLWPLLVLAVVLSYRRSFWLVTTVAVIIVLVLGASRVQRRFGVPAVLLVAGLLALVLSSSYVAGLQGPVVDRAKSLSPAKISASSGDRYRITERGNVLEEIRRRPVAGLGIGVPWAARDPLFTETSDARLYVHVAVLWFWMKLGILGPIAYLGLVLAAALAGLRVFRHHPDARLACFGLASGACLAGLLVGELTATFTGADPRFTVVLGAQVGLLAVLHRQAAAARRLTAG